MLQAQHRPTQPTATAQMTTGWDPAGWSGASPSFGSGLSGLLGSPSPSCTLNLSDYVDTSSQQSVVRRPTPSAATGSAAQLNEAGQRHTDHESARDDITEHEHEHELDH